MAVLGDSDRARFSAILRSKPIRTLSGVSVVALMTKPYDCPHGTCIFCPGGTRFDTPQSYTGFEPAARRARLNAYDPYLQVQARLKHYLFLGYSPQKIEVIIIGGTFTTLPEIYRNEFISEIYRALNDFPEQKDGGTKSLADEKKKNETSGIRCVALAVETKPERCSDSDISDMLRYGVTRVEMGMQSIYDSVLEKNNRGHTIQDVKDSTKRLKDMAFKVDHHVMINLPFSDVDKDINSIRALWEDETLRPDAIKIYPTLVIKGTALYNMWKAGSYKAYPLKTVIDIIAEAEINSPRWLRIMRVERDIPSDLIEEGVKMPNLRQLVSSRIEEMGRKPNDIRSREIGHVSVRRKQVMSVNRENYRASGGDEIFISHDDKANDAIIGFVRLRVPDSRKEALIRELHVYGQQKVLLDHSDDGFQHSGIGRSLLEQAEEIAREEYSIRRMKVISGVGVREYYRKFGYKLESNYMVKEL
jgi:elongator complex protein 3